MLSDEPVGTEIVHDFDVEVYRTPSCLWAPVENEGAFSTLDKAAHYVNSREYPHQYRVVETTRIVAYMGE